jgi:Protein of unknown function (DUF2946)
MNWFRSKIRLGSRLALLALAMQFGLSFGHFHVDTALAAEPKQSGLGFAAMRASDGASQASASDPVRLKASSDSDIAPDGQATDHCAICAVVTLAHTMLFATPPYLPRPQAAAFLSLAADAEFIDLNAVGVAFQARAPPIS